ncbi:OmpW/AlkL family protein [Acinetobacter indicus]|uniref:OmpW/AlkL family protein n=1 Tax=Acinetobacter indicus TaxID=756892 RepID=UPI0009491E4A|nr:OmpW family outer membrane protein [Acinetobacter indicus]MDM1244168.1 OmpW family protein [Acinetobacter indicus]MDM1288221.1 OmpW family protein [Acinetobacter indicus]MDM1492272.1 OmpW family protein [Acinetobacter indicus]
MKKTLLFASTLLALPAVSYASPYFSLQDGDGFKRFSVSVGALHVMPQGKAQPFQVNTAVKEGETARVGDISIDAVKSNIDPNMDPNLSSTFVNLLDQLNIETLPAAMSGTAEIHGLESWNNPGTGLEADDVTTLGIMTNYFFTDNVSFEVKAGIPPKVDLQGKGKIYAPFSAVATPSIDLIEQIPGGIDLPAISMKNDLLITDLEAHGPAASARAWTPAFEFQYHFGKTGVNKFRPYVGLGLMYAYFNELEINPRTEQDLIAAGHMIANIKQGQAGASLEGTPSNANPKVELEASDAFAPVATVGFTYDFNEKWFAVGSLSYAHLQNDTTITVTDATHGELIRSKADIEVNPILAYAGIGIRF